MEGNKDYYYINGTFPNYDRKMQFDKELEDFRDKLKSLNPGFTITCRVRCSHPSWATYKCNDIVSIRTVNNGRNRTERVLNEFHNIENIFKKYDIEFS